MLALDTIRGHRVVANPAVLDAIAGPALRLAPDELFVVGDVSIDDEHAIVVADSGFVGAWLDPEQLAQVAAHTDWPLPTTRPALAQGFVAGVPAKLWLTDDGSLLLCAAPYAVELAERLS